MDILCKMLELIYYLLNPHVYATFLTFCVYDIAYCELKISYLIYIIKKYFLR